MRKILFIILFMLLSVAPTSAYDLGEPPGGDRLVMWDESDADVAWMTIGMGLNLTGTTLAVAPYLLQFSGTTMSTTGQQVLEAPSYAAMRALMDLEAGTDFYSVVAIDSIMLTRVNNIDNETIGGVKTFSSFPVTPSSAPTTDYQVANKKYVDDHGITTFLGLNDTPATYTPGAIVRSLSDGVELAPPSVFALDDFGSCDDNTDLNATTTQHGLLPKLGGGTTNFLRADGAWAAPPAAGLVLDASPDVDASFAGVTLRDVNAGETITQWALVYFAAPDNEWKTANAGLAGAWPARGVATTSGSDGVELRILTQGVIRNDSWNWVVGGNLYLAETAGGLTQTPPTTSGSCVQLVGWAVSADAAYINISGHYLEVE